MSTWTAHLLKGWRSGVHLPRTSFHSASSAFFHFCSAHQCTTQRKSLSFLRLRISTNNWWSDTSSQVGENGGSAFGQPTISTCAVSPLSNFQASTGKCSTNFQASTGKCSSLAELSSCFQQLMSRRQAAILPKVVAVGEDSGNLAGDHAHKPLALRSDLPKNLNALPP